MTSAVMTEAHNKVGPKVQEVLEFQRILYIFYLALFDKFIIKALIDLSSKVNAI